jgi:hypothetical protein
MKILSILLILLSAQMVQAEEIISSFKVSLKNKNLNKISEEFEIKDRLQDHLLIYVIKEKQAEFQKLAPNAILVEKDINVHIKNKSLSGYHNFAQVKALYYELAQKYPGQAQIIKYGESAKGHELFALKVSDNVTIDEKEPKLMLTSATHGDELITVEVQLRLVEKLLNDSAKNPRLKAMIDEHELYFIPVVNPDGYTRRSRYASGWTDPNRDYPWPDRPDRTSKVTCIKHLVEFFHKYQFEGSMDIHASGKMVMFPWAYTKDEIASADFNFMQKLTTDMAKENGYRHGPISRVIYVAKGSSADYYYWKNGTVALAIELTTSKVPSAAKIPEVVSEAQEMVWKFIEAF